jgi:hypothetical protein
VRRPAESADVAVFFEQFLMPFYYRQIANGIAHHGVVRSAPRIDYRSRFGIRRSRHIRSITDHKCALTSLWHTEISGVQRAYFSNYTVPSQADPVNERVEHLLGVAEHQAVYVFENEVLWFDLSHEPRKLVKQLVSFVVRIAFAPDGEALAGWTTKNEIDFALAANPIQELSARDSAKIDGQGGNGRKVLLVSPDVALLIVEGAHDAKARLLEAQGHAPDAAAKIDSDGLPFSHQSSPRQYRQCFLMQQFAQSGLAGLHTSLP